MNHNPHWQTPTPCEQYEFDLFEHSEGTLAPERRATVQRHLQTCPRCQHFARELERQDAMLSAGMARPQLSADFDRKLQDRIAALARAPSRGDARAVAEREHEQMLASLRRGLRWRTTLNAVATAAVAAGVLVAADAIAPGIGAALGFDASGSAASSAGLAAFGVVAAAIGMLAARGMRPGSGVALFN